MVSHFQRVNIYVRIVHYGGEIMLIGTALEERKRLLEKADTLSQQISDSFTYRFKPTFQFSELNDELNLTLHKITVISNRIRESNLKSKVRFNSRERSLQDVMSEIEELDIKIGIYKNLILSIIDNSKLEEERYQYPPKKLSADMNKLIIERNKMKEVIQKASWTKELIE